MESPWQGGNSGQASAKSSKLVLVVEDEPVARRGLAEYLRYKGFKVRVARSGPEAVHKAIQYRPGVVTMDIYMPGRFDGIEAAKRIQEADPGVAVLFVTAHSEVPEYQRRVQELELRIGGWFDKPLLGTKKEKLIEKIAEEMERDPMIDVVDFETGGAEMGSSAEEITRLYAQIRALVARSKQESSVQTEIDARIQQLRALQEREAKEWRSRLEAQLHLKPGLGWKMLDWAARRLGDA